MAKKKKVIKISESELVEQLTNRLTSIISSTVVETLENLEDTRASRAVPGFQKLMVVKEKKGARDA